MYRKVNYINTKLIFSLLLLFVSCNFDYEEGSVAEELDKTLPDVVMDEVVMYFVRGTSIKMEAKKIEIYSDRKSQEMSEVSFSESDKNEEIRLQGKADLAIVETDTNNVTITGNFFARSSKDEAEIATNYLQWFDEEKRIEGSDSEKIVINRDDGSSIEGYGFEADAKKRTLSLKGGVEGKLAVDE